VLCHGVYVWGNTPFSGPTGCYWDTDQRDLQLDLNPFLTLAFLANPDLTLSACAWVRARIRVNGRTKVYHENHLCNGVIAGID